MSPAPTKVLGEGGGVGVGVGVALGVGVGSGVGVGDVECSPQAKASAPIAASAPACTYLHIRDPKASGVFRPSTSQLSVYSSLPSFQLLFGTWFGRVGISMSALRRPV